MMLTKLTSTLVPALAPLSAAAGTTFDAGPVGTVGAVTLLAWYVWHDVKYARPGKDKQHLDQITQMNDRHVKQMKDMRSAFQVTNAACEKRRQDEFDRNLVATTQLTESIRQLACNGVERDR